MYEQGMDERFARTPLARGTSSGIHESQSRLIENVVGRSLGFWQRHYPRLAEAFPQALGDVSVEAFHRAINAVKPSLIRVEADELTYNLHIVLRFELERALVRGDLAVADLPAAWNDGMRDLLGITPPTDREGVLQDVHWTAPMFGYFPTYALGNLYAAQFHEAACRQEPAIADGLADGQVAPLLAWLRDNVHRFGSSLTPAELVERATGSPLDPDAFTRYATAKFTAVYGLGG
jgi:carboxypeptidase Taq